LAAAIVAASGPMAECGPGFTAEAAFLCDHSADNPDKAIPAPFSWTQRAMMSPNYLVFNSDRGAGWVQKGVYGSAISDFNEAINRRGLPGLSRIRAS
jgi:hypothetical protein